MMLICFTSEGGVRSRPLQHPLEQGRRKLLPFPREALLVRPEVRNALLDLVAL
jgi:hypothetical protein